MTASLFLYQIGGFHWLSADRTADRPLVIEPTEDALHDIKMRLDFHIALKPDFPVPFGWVDGGRAGLGEQLAQVFLS